MGSGRLLGGVGLLIYTIFVLLPASSTQAITWPWVLIWQTGLFCLAAVALLRLWRRQPPFWLLGNKLDWAIALLFISLCSSTIFAQFPAQALWYSSIGFALIAALYTTHNYLHQTGKLNWLLTFQGGLSLAFIVESLVLWVANTLVPKLSQLDQLRQIGINFSYDFSDIESRNWAPLGHQNYVAGFLMLAIPLLFGLAIAQKRGRKIWSVGACLGLVDLYTTSSRGGFLGILVLLLVGILVLLLRSKGRIKILLGGMGAIAATAVLIFFNNRLQSLVSGLLSGRGGSELLYRIIAAYTGGQIGLDHMVFGAGPGSAALFYQRYRPAWAGREAEMLFQLHSTPVQIWAELGSAGLLTSAIAIFALLGLFARLHFCETWRRDREHQIFTYALFGGLLAYGVQSLTDYQLDVFAISGSLIITTASLTYIGQMHAKDRTTLGDYPQPRRWLAGTMTAFAIAAIVWIVPVDTAWHFSSVAFNYIDDIEFDIKSGNLERVKDDLAKFEQNLQRSHELASWESYYPYQLGWNLGNLARLYPDPAVRAQLSKEGLEWLKKGIQANPYQEFGYNNAAWLSLERGNPKEAETHFRSALGLVPAKRGLFYGLGMSLLRQEKWDAGIGAIAREWLNDPIFITSPIWPEISWPSSIPANSVSGVLNNLPSTLAKLSWQSVAYQSAQKLDSLYKQLLDTNTQRGDLHAQLLHTRAVVDWWLGKPGAVAQLHKVGSPMAQMLADALENKQAAIQPAIDNPSTPAQMAIAAWFKPDLRSALLEKAWAMATRSLPDPNSAVVVQAMTERMNQSTSLDAWLRKPLPQNSPLILQFRRERTGFGVLSRHDDSPIPAIDYLQVESNAIVSTFFADLFPTQGTLGLSGF